MQTHQSDFRPVSGLTNQNGKRRLTTIVLLPDLRLPMGYTVACCKCGYSLTVAGAASALPVIGAPTSRLISITTVVETPEVLLPAQYRGRPPKLQAIGAAPPYEKRPWPSWPGAKFIQILGCLQADPIISF
jgi:hypothetical protein